jgi:hypothetical protein
MSLLRTYANVSLRLKFLSPGFIVNLHFQRIDRLRVPQQRFHHGNGPTPTREEDTHTWTR